MSITLETVSLPSTPVHVEGYVKLHAVTHADKEFSQVLTPEGVTVFIINDRREVLLVKVFRPASGLISWEMPGGSLDLDEDPRDAAVRETLEETNFPLTAEKLFFLGTVFSDPSVMSDKIHLFLQKVPLGREVDAIKPNDEEILDARWYSLHSLEEGIKKNQVVDSATIVAFAKAKLLGLL